MQYFWNDNTLRNKLRYLEELKRKGISQKLLESVLIDIEEIKFYLESMEDEDEEQLSLLETFLEEKNLFKEIPFLIDDINTFSKLTKKKAISVPEIKERNLSLRDICDLTHDFYHQLDRHLFYMFMQNFKKRKDHLTFTDNYLKKAGDLIFLKSQREAFIKINRSFSHDDVLTTIHEYGHAVSFQINPNKFHLNSIFREIESLFLELIASDYFTNLINPDFTFIKANYFNGYCYYAQNLNVTLRILNREKLMAQEIKSNKELKQVASKCNIPAYLVEDSLSNPFNAHIYVASYIFAIELYNLYQQDKDKALYIFKKIIKFNYQDQKQYYYNIKRLGLVPNLHVNEFTKDLTSDVRKYTRKKH